MRRRASIVFVGLALLVVALSCANLCLGSVAIAPGELVEVLAGADAEGGATQIVWSIRLPRLIAAGLLGGALALSGVLLQVFFNNPLAGPYILGISSGAKLAVAVVMIVIVGASGIMWSWMSVVAAFVGSLGVMLLMLLVSRRVGSAGTLVVAGVMFGYICSALTDFLITFANDASIVSLRNWSMGSFSGTNWDDVLVIAVVVLGASAFVFLLSKPLGAYLLGEAYAQSVGVNIRAFRIATIALSSLLAACVTAFAGPISFVGIAVPHLVKWLFGTSKPLVVVPGAFLGGAAFCLLCDLIARTAFAPTEMSVSTVTAVFGAPVVVWVLLGRHRARGALRAGDDAEMATVMGFGTPLGTDVEDVISVDDSGVRPAASGVVFEAEDISVGYGEQVVVEGISMAVDAGAIVALIGPNGAGKSTMLRTIAGLQQALRGSMRLCGKSLGKYTPRELSLTCAVLLTERPRTELLTCADVVEAGRYPHTGRLGVLSDVDRARVREAMELLHVWGLRDRDFMQISDGQRQRVMLARALCQEPCLLVLDEPTSFLDIRYQVELFDTLHLLARERGLCIVMSLHELTLARQVSDWLVCVKDGSLLTQGTPGEVFVPEVIDRLFDLVPGTFDARTGEIRLGMSCVGSTHAEA